MQFIALLGIRAAIIGTAIWLWWDDRATPGDLAYVLTTYFVIHGYLRDVGMHINNLRRSVNDMEELVEIHRERIGVPDHAHATPIRIGRGEVAFDRVTFHYGGHVTPLYRDLSLTIRAGERVGLVGPSGSGKTTLVKLIQRLYDVTGGEIRIDGQNIADATAIVPARRRSPSCSRSRSCSTARSPRTSPMGGPGPAWPRSSVRRGSPTRMTSS